MSQRPPKPTRAQQKQQAKVLESLIKPSSRVNINQFRQSIRQVSSSTTITSESLQRACSLNDLMAPLAPIYKDSNLLSELRDHQHELATPHGSLHALHHSTELQPQAQESLPQPTVTSNQPSDTPADIPVHSKPIPDYLDPALFSASASSTISTLSKASSYECNDQKPRRIRKKAAGPPQSINHKPKPIQDLITRLSATSLKLLQPDFDGMWYVRSVGRSDWNTSTQPMNSNLPATELNEMSADEPSVILTITFHPFSKTSANNQESTETKSIAPRKQTIHILSNQRLSDLRDAIVCSADKIPICYNLDGTKWGATRWISGSVFIIENVLFSDTRNLSDSQIDPQTGKSDYALLLQQLLPNLIQKDKVENLITRDDQSDTNSDNDNEIDVEVGKVQSLQRNEMRKKIQISSLSMEQVQFDQITLRINEPYWMLHQGNCEHLFTIDEIRAMHPTDPSPNSFSTLAKKTSIAGEMETNENVNNGNVKGASIKTMKTNPYPIMSFLSRISSPKCRVCDRDPAQLVTISDELCSESPCFICLTCFKFLHSHEDIFEPLPPSSDKAAFTPSNNHDQRKIRWGKVHGREWWAVPLLESS